MHVSIFPYFASFRDENLCTVLSIAARDGHVKIMKILLEHYADINTKDKLKVALHVVINLEFTEVKIKCMNNSGTHAAVTVVFLPEYPAAYSFKGGPCRLCPTSTRQKGRPVSEEYLRENSARCRRGEEAFRRRCDLHEVGRVSLRMLVIHVGFRLLY